MYIIPSIQLFVRCDSVHNSIKYMQHIDISAAFKRQMWSIHSVKIIAYWVFIVSVLKKQ